MIDWSRLEELKRDIGEDDFGDVIVLFLEEVDEVIERLENAGSSDLAADMHLLKGSALNLGFDEFGELCSQAEVMAATDAGAVDVPGVIAAYRASRAAFVEGLA